MKIKIINALGEVFSYIYDEQGNLTEQIDPKGNFYSYEYDSLNRVVREINRLGLQQTFSYDANGNVIEKTTFDGAVSVSKYDDLNRLIGKERIIQGCRGTGTAKRKVYHQNLIYIMQPERGLLQ